MDKLPFKQKIALYLCAMFVLTGLCSPLLFAETEPGIVDETSVETEKPEAWTGIDVSIVGKYATKYGRPPRDPYINTDQGDLLLFVFTLAGVIGGFVMGFNARKLFFEKQPTDSTEK